MGVPHEHSECAGLGPFLLLRRLRLFRPGHLHLVRRKTHEEGPKSTPPSPPLSSRILLPFASRPSLRSTLVKSSRKALTLGAKKHTQTKAPLYLLLPTACFTSLLLLLLLMLPLPKLLQPTLQWPLLRELSTCFRRQGQLPPRPLFIFFRASRHIAGSNHFTTPAS